MIVMAPSMIQWDDTLHATKFMRTKKKHQYLKVNSKSYKIQMSKLNDLCSRMRIKVKTIHL